MNEPVPMLITKLKVWYVLGFRPEIEGHSDPRSEHIALKARFCSPAVLEEADLARLPIGPGLEFTEDEVSPLRDAMRRAHGAAGGL